MQESGYKTSTSNAQTEVKTNKNRSRSIIWFNPPFSQNVKTNIGKIFLKLIIKIFPSHHRLNIIFNLNTTRLRNSCRVICQVSQNKLTIIFYPRRQIAKNVHDNFQQNNCPLAGSCLKTCIVYRDNVTKQNETHAYFGASDGEFKYRYNNHKNSFRNQDYENEIELSKHIWQLKRNGTEVNLKWSIAAYGTPYKCGTRRCDLCLTEKYIIARANQNNLYNRRTEFISKCRIYFIRHILNWFTVKQFKS